MKLNKLVTMLIAVVAIGVGFIALPAMAGNLPLPESGLVVHLDASDLSTITTNANGNVTAWRSKVGSVTFGSKDGLPASERNLPYYMNSVGLPKDAGVPAVQFGFAPGYDYASQPAATNKLFVLKTAMNSDTSVTAREVILVWVPMQNFHAYSTTDIDGNAICPADTRFFTVNSQRIAYPGNQWSTGIVGGNGFINATGKIWCEFVGARCGK